MKGNSETKIQRRGFVRLIIAFGIGNLAGIGLSGCASMPNTSMPAAPIPDRNSSPFSVTTQNDIRITHIQTGYVAVKRAHWEYVGPDGTGILAVMSGSRFIDWVPISCWLIEHPEGKILVDTGETYKAVSDNDYFNCDSGTNFFYRRNLRFNILPEEEVLPQLLSISKSADSIRWIVQTHLHSDHMGGLKDFPSAQVFVPRQDYPRSTGALPCRYPSWLNPSFAEFSSSPLEGFPKAFSLTRAKDVWIVPTPGHTPGHQSVIVNDGSTSYFFAGDASFTQDHLLRNTKQGIASEPKQQRFTQNAIKAYCKSTPTVYLPSHDRLVRKRLLNRETLRS